MQGSLAGSYYFPPAQPGRRGLLTASVAVTQQALADYDVTSPVDWQNGFRFMADSCDAVDGMLLQCLGSPKDKELATNPDDVEIGAFLTFGSDVCSTIDAGRPREVRARRNLAATESWQIEREMFDGAASLNTDEPTPPFVNPYLTDGTTASDATGGGAAIPATRALARLEQALVECLHGQRGMIHATPELVTLWQAGGALRIEGNTLLTVLDTIVVAGSGYSGAGPDATPAAAGTSWAYGTSLVYLLQGTVSDPASTDPASRVDRAINTTTWIVERPNALIFAPCCVKAVHASLTS